jgi:cytochrome c oxidase subunit 3
METTYNSLSDSESEIRKEKVFRNLLYISIFSIVMLFGGLTSAYIVRQADGGWMQIGIPFMFWVSTISILLSSATINYAIIAARKSNSAAIINALGATILLGIVFSISQYLGWTQLVADGVFFAGPSSNPAGSFIYVLTGMHLLHIFSGLIYLAVVFSKALKKKYHSGNTMGIKHAAIYWHFLDILWIYLFVFLLIIR